MSVRFDVAGYGLSQAANVAPSTAWTAMCWVKINTRIVPVTFLEYQTFIKLYDSTGFGYFHYYCDYDDFKMTVSDGVNDGYIGSLDYEASKWYHVTIVRETNINANRYRNFRAQFDMDTVDTDGLLWDQLKVGYDGIASEPGIQVAYFREWNAALTQPEIMAEVLSATAVRVANLLTDTPLASDYLDDSGNGNDWTPVGVPTFAGQPTLPTPPSNWIEAGAIVIPSLPYEVIQTSVDSEGFAFDVWYQYTPVAEDVVLSINIRNNGGGSYNPWIDVYIDDSSKLLNTVTVDRMTQHLAFEGRPFLFEVYPTRPSEDAELTVSILSFPVADEIPRGSFAIRAGGMPALWTTYGIEGTEVSYVDPITGEIFHYGGMFPPGESGDAIPNGRMLFADDFEVEGVVGKFKLIDHNFNVITELFWPWDIDWPCIRASRETNTFYVSRYGTIPEPTGYVTVSSAGVMSSEVLFPGITSGVAAIANSADDLYVYAGVGMPSDLKKYNKATALFETDIDGALYGPGPGFYPYVIWDILVMATGELVVLYQNGYGTPTDIMVKIYSAAGAVLNTYIPPASVFYSNIPTRLGYADDAVSFWIFLHVKHFPYAHSRFINIRVSDLTVLEDIDAPDAYYMAANQGATPTYRFVTSDSCPLVQILTPIPERGGIYTLVPPPVPPLVPPGPRRDKYIGADSKIPNPTIRTALFGE